MARKVKIDNAILKRSERQETKRRQDVQPKRRFYLIVCEGTKTEKYYFEGLKANMQPGVISLVEIGDIIGTRHNTLWVVQDALKEKQRLEQVGRTIDEVWAVFDRDSFPSRDFNNAIAKGEEVGVHCAWTNEAFELWYLLHFQLFENAMSRKRYKALIERELSQKLGQPYVYQKNSPNMFTLLKEYGNIEQAIAWAKQLEAEFAGPTDYANHNPCTKVYELIGKLLFPKLDDITLNP